MVELAYVQGWNVAAITPSLGRVVHILLLTWEVVLLREKAIKVRLVGVGARVYAPRFTIKADSRLQRAHVGAQKVLLWLFVRAASVMTLTSDELDLGKELLLPVESGLGSNLILLHLLVHFHRARSRRASRLKRIAPAL